MKFLRRLWFWLHRRQMHGELEEEVRQHLQKRAEDGIRQGLAANEAWRQAHLSFGNSALATEYSRRTWGLPALESVVQDLRYGARQLLRSPGFAAAAILTLALGIGANIAIFSAVYSVLLRPLPFKDPDRLLMIRKKNPPRNWDRNAISAAEILAWKSETHAFEDIAIYMPRSCVVSSGGHVDEYACEAITRNLFPVLGVPPFRGRNFSGEEDRPGGPQAVILSYGLWQRSFGGDERVLGQSISVGGAPATVVGIMPAGFSHLYASPYESTPELWLSGVRLVPSEPWNNYFGVGRLRPGVAVATAQKEMDVVSLRLEQTSPGLKGWQAHLLTLRSYAADVRPALFVLGGAVSFVLLIACANVANLLLARGAGRTGEFAVRKALGAAQSRLVRQLLTENLLISISGGTLGVLFACLGTRGLVAVAPESLLKSAPGLLHAATDWAVLGFATAVAVATALVFGLAPAIQSSRLEMTETMKESGRALLENRRTRRIRDGMAILEIALAMVLLVGAGLMARTLTRLSRVLLGFNSANVLTLRVPIAGERYKDQNAVVQFWRRVMAGVEGLPGVEAASVTRGVPLDDFSALSFATAENPHPLAGQEPDTNYLVIAPDYFRVMRLPILQGRPFDAHDGPSGENVAIVNEELARRYWPGQSALGKQVRLMPDLPSTRWLTVVGVAGNVLTRGPQSGFYPEIYVPYDQLPWTLAAPRKFIVRTRPDVKPESVAEAVTREIHRVDKDQPVSDLRTMEDISGATRSSERMLLALLGSFAGLALVLSAIGIYGILSYAVAQRTREIGVRMAFGARRADVLRLVVGSGIRMALLGIAAGIAAALLLTRVMTDLLYEVRATDPATFATVAALLGAVSLAACYVPARRALNVDPMVALRHD